MTMRPRTAFPARIIFRTPWRGEQFYTPKETGFEREIAKRLDYWAKLRAKRGGGLMQWGVIGMVALGGALGSVMRYVVAGFGAAGLVAGFSLRHFRRQHHRRAGHGLDRGTGGLETQSHAGTAGLSHHRHSGRLYDLLHLLAG